MMKGVAVTLMILILVVGVSVSSARQAEELPLSEPGTYTVGLRLLTFVDGARDGRELDVAIFYPAIEPEDTSARDTAKMIGAPFAGFRDAEPDRVAAPYPLILFSPAMGDGAIDWVAPLNHLASHGFVVASIGHNCAEEPTCMIDRPLDILFALNELAVSVSELADTDNTGVMGVETGGYTALVAGGAQIDSDAFLNWAATRDESQPVAIDHFSEWFGWNLVSSWDEIEAYRAQHVLQTDERIRAIMPITPAFGMIFGEPGLASVTVPTLIVAITANLAVSYEDEVVPVFNNLGAEDRYLVTLVDYQWSQGGHVKWPHPQEQVYYNHFMLAFFGNYLQGQDAYTEYLTPNSVADFDDVVWGVAQ